MLHGHAVASKRLIISRRDVAGQDIPIAKSNVARGLSSPRHSLKSSEQTHHLSMVQRWVLIVGDTPGLCTALASSLSHPSLRIRTAVNAASARSILGREKIDFVIAELNLSAGGGIDFLATVRLEYPDTTRVLITGECDIAVIRDAIRRSGVSFFLGKPWDTQSLRELVRSLLLVELPIRGQEPAIAADFETEVRAQSASESLAPHTFLDLTCNSLSQARASAAASFAQCETEGELAAILDRAFTRFVQPHQLWWWEHHPGTLARVDKPSHGNVMFDRVQLAPSLTRVLDSIHGSSRPFVFGLGRMIAREPASSRNVLVVPVIAGGECLASVLVTASEAQPLSGWPLDLAGCLTDALGPTLLRIRRVARGRAQRCDRDQRIAERLKASIACVSRALAEIAPSGPADRGDCEAVQFIRSETLQLSHLAEELQRIVSDERCAASCRE